MKKIKLVPLKRQREDRELMRWLYSKGVMPWELAELRIGAVDEFEKTIHIHPNVTGWEYNFKTGEGTEIKREREEYISFSGTPFEERLRYGAIYSGFLFTRSFPVKIGDNRCGYSVEEVEEILQIDYEKLLTNRGKFDNIEVTKTNIKNWKKEARTKANVV